MKNVKSGHTKPIVCLDAGHYGKYNRCPAIKDYYESLMVWELHLMLKKYLEQYGIEVKTTRSNQTADLDLYKRGTSSKGCDLFLSIHSNAVGGNMNESVDYPVVYVQLDGKGDELGKKIADAIEDIMDTKQKGRISKREGNRGEYYGVLRGAAAVETIGLIIEHSFHTNTRAVNWLMDNSNLDRMAKVEAEIIADWFGIQMPVKTDEPKWYRIRKSWDDAKSQIAAYVDLENAKRSCPDGYIVYDNDGNPVYQKQEKYTLEQFIREVQTVIGAKIDGKAGPETLSKTITVSRKINNKNAAIVKPIQKRLIMLGYNPGAVDGSFGPQTEAAVKALQRDYGKRDDGEITARNITWKKLLGMV